jgi:hypothetical protein
MLVYTLAHFDTCVGVESRCWSPHYIAHSLFASVVDLKEVQVYPTFPSPGQVTIKVSPSKLLQECIPVILETMSVYAQVNVSGYDT